VQVEATLTSRAAHLTGRFFGSLLPFGPSAADLAWVETVLQPGELTLWRRMPRADRRETVGVARRTQAALGEDAKPDILAAALLHDVGKTEARLGVFGRTFATMAGAVAGHGMARAWQEKGGVRRRYGLYLRHDAVGAGMLRMAGARRAAIEWADAHHRPERWTGLSFPYRVAVVLAEADGERIPDA
jgi:HD domain